jgi:V8-like Glu-specific endopeptidase
MKIITLAGLAVIACTTAVAAQPDPDQGAYWTPDRIRNAKPLDLPTANVRLTPVGPIQTLGLRAQTSPEVGTATPPDADVEPNLRRELFPTSPDVWSDDDVPTAVAPRSAGEPVAAGDVGELEAFYTSSRLVPTTSANYYPWRANGKLFLTIPGEGDAVCSAATLERRLIVTAGHCVFGNGRYYKNFLFVPAYHKGKAPFKAWEGKRAIATASWVATEDPCLGNDVALIEIPKKKTFKGKKRTIGEVTGTLSFATNGIINHLTQIGYPSNLDAGEIMHHVTSQVAGQFEECDTTFCYGNDMGSGSSGGAWVENFGKAAKGQGALSPDPNRIVAVASYGPAEPDPYKVTCAGALTKQFRDIRATACGWTSGNCSSTRRSK